MTLDNLIRRNTCISNGLIRHFSIELVLAISVEISKKCIQFLNNHYGSNRGQSRATITGDLIKQNLINNNLKFMNIHKIHKI